MNNTNLYMEKYKGKIQETLFRLIRIPSFKGQAKVDAPFGEGPKEALEEFLKISTELGFRTKNIDNYAGYAEMGPDDNSLPMIAAVCHLDVVPADGWEDAFEPKFADDNDTIIGRGSVDDKGPTVSVLYALKSLMDDSYKANCRIRLIVGTDEESGSECLKYYVKKEEIPIAAFTADADFPVINGEKGHLAFDLVWANPNARPKDGEFKLYSAKCGAKANVVPGEAKLTFKLPDGSFEEIETLGKMGHASTPEMYENAIQLALKNAYDLSIKHDTPDLFLEEYMDILNLEYNGASIGAAMSDEPSGNLTLNVGLFSLDDKEARFRIDIRYPVTIDSETVLNKIKTRIESTSFEIENIKDSIPLYRPEDDVLVRLLMRSYNEVTGNNSKPFSMGGGTYARSLPNTIAFGANFPDNPYLGHAKYEYAKLSDMIKASEIFRIAIQRMDETYAK